MDLDVVVPHWYMYPPKCSYSDSGSVSYSDVPTPETGTSLYLHVPFCNMKCSFCSLYTSTGYSDAAAGMYVTHLVKEIQETIAHFSHVRSPNLYFGGGTPALLTGRHLQKIMEALSPILTEKPKSRSVEFSPDVVTNDRIEIWREHKFDRVSLGIQSFDDKRLSIMRRQHDGKRATDAIEQLELAGFKRINIDLIFGGHGQTLVQWRKDLKTAISSGADSCTFHPLALVSKTPIERKLDKADVGTNHVHNFHQEAVNMFNVAGWKRTSAISFSRSGEPNPVERAESEGTETYGFGAGARSYLGRLHLSTLPAQKKMGFGAVLSEYYAAVDRREKPALSCIALSEEELVRRALILRLHHGTIDHKLIEATESFEGQSLAMLDLKNSMESMELSAGERSYRIRDEALPMLAKIGMNLASEGVQLDVSRTLGIPAE